MNFKLSNGQLIFYVHQKQSTLVEIYGQSPRKKILMLVFGLATSEEEQLLPMDRHLNHPYVNIFLWQQQMCESNFCL